MAAVVEFAPSKVRFREFNRRTKRGTVVKIVREQYLRSDLPCLSQECNRGCQQWTATAKTAGVTPTEPNNNDVVLEARLTSNASHYLVPDTQTCIDFMELLEQQELTNLIICETVLNAIQWSQGTRSSRRLRKIVEDARRSSVVFNNETSQETFCERQQHDTLEHRNLLAIFKAASWYSRHLNQRIPIVFLTSQAQNDFPQHDGVIVLSPQQYLATFWPDAVGLAELCASLISAIEERNQNKFEESSRPEGHLYDQHLSAENLEAGIKSGLYYRGRLNVSARHAQNQAFVLNAFHDRDVLIVGNENRNRAVHGDIVAVELLPESAWKQAVNDQEAEILAPDSQSQPTGRIIGIVQRNLRPYVATLSPDPDQSGGGGGGHVLAVPMDFRIPKIRIAVHEAQRFHNQRLVVLIHDWPAHSMYPNGHYVKSLGPVDALDTEVMAVLVENDLTVNPFSEALMASMPKNTPQQPWTITEKDIAERRDLRNQFIFSIDPKGSEDIDDALSVQRLSNGNVELGVHIADVSAFVTPGSLCDMEARFRGTTIYLADRRFNMLPAVLSEDLCSLRGNQNRFAVSAIAEVDKDGKVVSTWYGRTLIRSAREMYYEQAQAILNEHDQVSFDAKILADLPEAFMSKARKTLPLLREVTRILRAKRLSLGAVELSSQEVRFKMDAENKQVENLVTKSELEIHKVVAEAMILANALVAEQITRVFATRSLLRRHPQPLPSNFAGLQRLAKSMGHEIDTRSNGTLSASLDLIADSQSDAVVANMIKSLAITAMNEAEYFCTGTIDMPEWYHYGLALDYYTHFTSPIRRYADIVVHRALLLSVKPTSETTADDLLPAGHRLVPDQSEVATIAEHLNRKNRASKAAQRDCTELFQALFIKHELQKGSMVESGIVFDVRDGALLVFVPRLGLKAWAYLKDKSGSVIIAKSVISLQQTDAQETIAGCTLTRPHSSQLRIELPAGGQLSFIDFNLFDSVLVSLSLSTTFAHRPTIQLQLVCKAPRNSDPSTAPRMNRSSLMNAIQQNETANLRTKAHQQSTFAQTSSDQSLYDVLERMRLLALQDD